ncbi:MAG: hypothetical protein KY475_23765, partial [Planctomycetes bacterium]|nr:hypothetical protein [Planctomycetota bacterium]
MPALYVLPEEFGFTYAEIHRTKLSGRPLKRKTMRVPIKRYKANGKIVPPESPDATEFDSFARKVVFLRSDLQKLQRLPVLDEGVFIDAAGRAWWTDRK